MMQKLPGGGGYRLNFADSPMPAKMQALAHRASIWTLAHVAYGFAAVNFLSGLLIPATSVLEQFGWCLVTGAAGVLPMRLTLRRLRK